MKIWHALLLKRPKGQMTILPIVLATLISGCSWINQQPIVVVSNECSWYDETTKISCVPLEQRKALGIPEGVKCSDIISTETMVWKKTMDDLKSSCPNTKPSALQVK